MKRKKVLSILLVTVTIISQCLGNYPISNAAENSQDLQSSTEGKLTVALQFSTQSICPLGMKKR